MTNWQALIGHEVEVTLRGLVEGRGTVKFSTLGRVPFNVLDAGGIIVRDLGTAEREATG